VRPHTLAVLAALAACDRAPAPRLATADDLAAYISDLAASDPDAAARELARWPLDRALWQRTLVEPYRALWDELAPEGRLRALRGELRRGAVTARRHYADDPRLTPGQLWQRWALPTLYPSFVVEIDGRPLDAVFLHDGVRWRALAGLDELILARVRALDPGCATHLAGVVASADCASASWAVAEAALRNQPDERSEAKGVGTPRGSPGGGAQPRGIEQLARSCLLAASLCGKRSP
jgi:hypothetical protein